MATLRPPLPLPTPPRTPSRPRMNSTLTLITPDKAQALLETCYQGQRPLRQHHVRFLRHLMRTGHWRQGAEIHCARVEGERFLVNGQHTLTALMQEGLASWLTVVEIDVPTLAGIGRLYEAFDRNMTRSLDDIYQSDPEIGRYGWTTKQLKAMSGAVALLATGFAQDAPFADIVLTLRDPFVRKGLQLLVDGAEPMRLREVLEVELGTYEHHMKSAAKIWESAGGYAPTIGILGAVMGLIHVMENLSDPSKLGAGIAVAFVATIYGVGSANLIFLPIAKKLLACIGDMVAIREMYIDGLVGIANGDNPRIIESRLQGYFAH